MTNRGARVLVGGQRPARFERGFFLEPAVLIDVDHSMAIMREETFGPAIPLMPYRDFDEAIERGADYSTMQLIRAAGAGTADAMEVVARVDLTADEVRETVRRVRGCIAWNGRLNHSALDDVMNDQRKVIFSQRLEIMEAEDLEEIVRDMRHQVIDDLVDEYMPPRAYAEQWDNVGLEKAAVEKLNMNLQVTELSLIHL